MTIPYRTQRLIKRIVSAVLVLAVLIVAGVACWMIWVQRYIIYGADGSARLDFDLLPLQTGTLAVPPAEPDVSIYFDREEQVVNTGTELTQLSGYYADAAALKDIPTVKAQIQALPAGTAVMLEVKNILGEFFYSSKVGDKRNSEINTTQMDELITYLNRSDKYIIAKLPALRDYHFGLNNVPFGVHHSSGGYLHQDAQGCYWLNPGSEGALSYLTRIVLELRTMGFDEVVLDDFCFPQSEDILVSGDKSQLLTQAANVLMTACASDRFAVSFLKTEEFTQPKGRTRLYLAVSDAAQAEEAAQSSGIADTAVNLVFLTELHDTRFDAYGVLRPLSAAH